MFCNFCKRTNHSTQNCLHRIRRFGLENKRFKKSFRNGKLLCLETWKSTSDKERYKKPVFKTEITEPTKKTNVIIDPAKTNVNLAEKKEGNLPLINLDKATQVEEEKSKNSERSIAEIIKQNEILLKEIKFLKEENLALSILYFNGSTTFFDDYEINKREEKDCKNNASIKPN